MNDYKLKIGELRSYMESLLQVSGNLAPRKVGRRKNFNLREVFMRSFFESFFQTQLLAPRSENQLQKWLRKRKIGSKLWKPVARLPQTFHV